MYICYYIIQVTGMKKLRQTKEVKEIFCKYTNNVYID